MTASLQVPANARATRLFPSGWLSNSKTLVVCAALWIGPTLLTTGAGGFMALAAALTFLAELLLLTTLTRTVPLRLVVAAFFIGGSLISASWIGTLLYTLIDPDINSVARALSVPIMEEALKIAPVLALLWIWRRTWVWMLGASDVLVLSAAVGCGYDWVERAYKNYHAAGTLFHAPHLVTLWGLPTVTATSISQGQWNSGHAVCAAIVGSSLGLALYFRHRRRLAVILAAAGPAVAFTDHVRVNYSAISGGLLTKLLLLLTANGDLAVAVFVVGVAAAVSVDLFVGYGTPPARPGMALASLVGVRPLPVAWRLLKARCILAYFHWRARRMPGPMRPRLATLVAAALGGVALSALLGHAHAFHLLNDVQYNIPWWGAIPPIFGGIGGVGAAAGGVGGPNSPYDKDIDPCAGEKRAVLADQGTVDMLKGQLNSKAGQISALDAPMNQLLAQASALAPQAQSEVEQQFALTAITKLVQLVAEMSGDLGEGAAAVSSAVGLVSNPAGAVVGAADSNKIVEDTNFFKEMYQYFQVSQGNLNALEELCKDNPLPAASQFLQVMEELNQSVAQGYALVNAMNQIQDQLQDAQDKLNQDQKALDDCEAGNSGDGSSGSDS